MKSCNYSESGIKKNNDTSGYGKDDNEEFYENLFNMLWMGLHT